MMPLHEACMKEWTACADSLPVKPNGWLYCRILHHESSSGANPMHVSAQKGSEISYGSCMSHAGAACNAAGAVPDAAHGQDRVL